jgi:hypothetical protein
MVIDVMTSSCMCMWSIRDDYSCPLSMKMSRSDENEWDESRETAEVEEN